MRCYLKSGVVETEAIWREGWKERRRLDTRTPVPGPFGSCPRYEINRQLDFLRSRGLLRDLGRSLRKDKQEAMIAVSHLVEIKRWYSGELDLCFDVPDDAFDQYDVTNELQEEFHNRIFIVPAQVLNRLEPPKIYDHELSDCPREDWLQLIEVYESSDRTSGAQSQDDPLPLDIHFELSMDHDDLGPEWLCSRNMREAFEFFKRINWPTPLRLQDKGSQQ